MIIKYSYKFPRDSISRHLLTAKKVEAGVCCVLVRNDTQQPNAIKWTSATQPITESSTARALMYDVQNDDITESSTASMYDVQNDDIIIIHAYRYLIM